MANERLRYSDEMARRIKCLRKGSFECLVNGGVYNEEEAAAILPYLDVSYCGGGFCIAVVHSQLDDSSILAAFSGEEAPASITSRVITRRVGRRGYVHLKRDAVMVFWSPCEGAEGAGLHELLLAAAHELRSRHKVQIACGIGGWFHHLTDAPLSLQSAEAALQQTAGSREMVVGGDAPPARQRGADFRFAVDELGSRAAEFCEFEPARTIQEFIHSNFRDPNLGLGMVAERFGLTETYLSQLFKEQTGVNYSVYLESVRTGEAQRLLIETDVPVSEAAARVGYHINSTFYRAFKRRFGVSPSVYRGRAQGRTDHTDPAAENQAISDETMGVRQARAM